MDALPSDELKIRFARRYADNKGDALMIARDCFPPNTDAIPIINAAREWPHDPIVMTEVARLAKILPEKEEIAQQLLRKANSKEIEPEDQVKFYKLYIDLIHPSKTSTKDEGGSDRLNEIVEALMCPLPPAKVE